MTIYSCVDVLPIPYDDNTKKLFVDCEMTVGQDIEAIILYEGKSRGINPQYLEQPDTFSFTLAEGDTDFGVPFIYDYNKKAFVIQKNQLQLKAGFKYKFRGLGINKNSTEPLIIIPESFQADTIMVEKSGTQDINGKIFQVLKCSVRRRTNLENTNYLYVHTKAEDGRPGVPYFEQDFGAYKKMKHRDGFLVDLSRLKNDELVFRIMIEGSIDVRALLLDIGQVTKSYYQFNLYKSNSYTDPSQTAENLSIASFNIDTELARGSFSAINQSSMRIVVK